MASANYFLVLVYLTNFVNFLFGEFLRVFCNFGEFYEFLDLSELCDF